MAIPMPWMIAGASLAYLLHSGSISFRGVAGTVGVLASGLLYLLWRYQEHLLYQPAIFPQHMTPKDNPPGMRSPNEHGLPFEDLRIRTSDGLTLHAWFLRPESESERFARPTLLFFHENAGNMGLRMENLKLMYSQLHANVMILSYRGYGESEGKPSEEGLYLDGEAALQHLLGRSDIDRSRVVVFGRSLGGGVAIDVASKHEGEGGQPGTVAALIIENSFASISDMVDCVFPYLAHAKHFILRMRWESVIKVEKVTRPILFLSGAQDEIVPAVQMASLHRAATATSHKELVIFPEGKHNDTWQRGAERYLRVIREFLDTHAKPGAAPQELAQARSRSAL